MRKNNKLVISMSNQQIKKKEFRHRIAQKMLYSLHTTCLCKLKPTAFVYKHSLLKIFYSVNPAFPFPSSVQFHILLFKSVQFSPGLPALSNGALVIPCRMQGQKNTRNFNHDSWKRRITTKKSKLPGRI